MSGYETDSTDGDNSEGEDHIVSLEELAKWRVVDLKDWLAKRGVKKSGSKDVLVKRVHRVMTDMDSDISNEDEENVIPINLLCQGWKELDTTHIPPISTKDVDSYFIYHKDPITGMAGRNTNFGIQMKKAKRFCNEGFILKEIYFNAIQEGSDNSYFRCKCLPSMKKVVNVGDKGETATEYSLHVCLQNTTGLVFHAFCNCKPGKVGLCAHIGSLLYYLAKTKDSCTSTECQWDRPKPLERKPSPKRVRDIKFIKTEKDKHVEKVKPYPDVYKAGPCKEEGDIFLNEILDGLKDIYPECVLYQTLRPEHANIDSFLNLFLTDFSFMDNVNISSDHCMHIFSSFFNNLTVPPEISEKVEKATRGQHFNANWKQARNLLITASNMGAVVIRKKYK